MCRTSESKDELRKAVRALRHRQANKDQLSRRICERVIASQAYAEARTVMLYADVRSEVRTGTLLEHAQASGKIVAVPYCDGDKIVPWRVDSLDELSPGAFGIREPRDELRNLPQRLIDPQSIDLICVPGVAFDRQGNRLGSGQGYYDRLLPQLRPDAIKLGLAYECQMVDHVPVSSHDVLVDWIAVPTKISGT